jgi:spermidine synthase
MFPIHEYYYTVVPTYPGGMIGFTFFSKKYNHDKLFSEKIGKAGYEFVTSLRYWTESMHRAAFVLPHFAKVNIQNAVK